MGVLVCVVFLAALVAAEPPSYRQFKVNFEMDKEPKFSEINEGTTMDEEKPPYPAAGLKPSRELRLPPRFEKIRQPFSRSELPSLENSVFIKKSEPQTYYGLPEKNNELKEEGQNKEDEQRTNALRTSYEAPVYHQNPRKEYGTPEKGESMERNRENGRKSSEESRNLGKSTEVKIDESREKFVNKDKQRPEKNQKYTENNVEVQEQGNFRSKEENRSQGKERKTERYTENNVQIHEEGYIHSRESYEKRGQEEEKNKERENTEDKEKSQENSKDESVKRQGPFYIIVPPTPNFDVPYQKPVPLPAVYEGVPFQRQTDFSNTGYSSYYQQRAIDRAPFSYYYQAKLQPSPYVLPNTGNQWTNQW